MTRSTEAQPEKPLLAGLAVARSADELAFRLVARPPGLVDIAPVLAVDADRVAAVNTGPAPAVGTGPVGTGPAADTGRVGKRDSFLSQPDSGASPRALVAADILAASEDSHTLAETGAAHRLGASEDIHSREASFAAVSPAGRALVRQLVWRDLRSQS